MPFCDADIAIDIFCNIARGRTRCNWCVQGGGPSDQPSGQNIADNAASGCAIKPRRLDPVLPVLP
jgi:hypothetical protein